MGRRSFLSFLVTAGCLSAAGPGSSAPATIAEYRRPTGRAVALDEAPVLDGEVREDPVWRELEPLDSFWQVRPDEGATVSERTEVRIGYTDDALFVAVVCFDRESDAIIVSDARRDASLEETDSFTLVLDTFRDEQNGFVFGTNPAGIEYDGQVKNASDSGLGGSRFRSGSGGGFNLNWDGVWSVRTQLGSYGWSAELAIPWSTLRYPSAAEVQTWGANFQRNIRRRKETAYWAPLDRQRNLFWLQAAGSLEAVRPPLRRNLKLVPYVLAEAVDDAETDGGAETDSDAGLDLKYSVTPALTLDATVNTDFAQVEVDDQQINLDRFNLFFPEKRPFFLENAGLFSVGESGEVDLFFSRRIGIDEEGAEVPIVGGLRLSGKAAPHTNVGFLAMQTDDVAGLAPTTDFGVGRITRELPNRSFVGALFVRRDESASDEVPGGHENDTFAVDGQLGIGEYLTLSAFAARTSTPGLDGGEHAFSVESSYSSPDWRWDVGYLEVGEGFNPEVGFLARRGFRKPSFLVLRRVRPRHLLGLYELRPHISYRGYWDFNGFQETGHLHLDNHWEWPSGAQVHTGINFTREGVKEPFEISPGIFVPPGTYEHREIQLVGNTNAGAPVSFKGMVVAGGFFGGDRVSVEPTLSLRRGEMFTSELSWSHNNIDLPWGNFDVNLGKLRLSYSLSTRLLLQALLQYNDRSDDVSANLRFSWLRSANTGLFVVLNEIRELGSLAPSRPDRNIIVKYSHMIDLFP